MIGLEFAKRRVERFAAVLQIQRRDSDDVRLHAVPHLEEIRHLLVAFDLRFLVLSGTETDVCAWISSMITCSLVKSSY